MFSPFGGTSILFSIIPIIVTAGFIFVFGAFVCIAVKGIAQWNTNNNSPKETEEVKVVAKRADVSRHSHNHTNNMHTGSRTQYYVTFELRSGERKELSLSGNEYGVMIEGDEGTLSFQGTRFIAFKRS